MAKNKTIINIYKELVQMGQDVKIYKRKDGGYLIKSIGGKKFTGAKGNIYARQLVGVQGTGISKAKQEQLSSITTLRSQSKEFKELYKQTREIWKEVKKAGTLKAKGKIKPQKTIQYLKTYGIEEAKKALIKKQQYAQGIAYNENVAYFRAKLERILLQYNEWFSDNINSNIIIEMDSIITFLTINESNIKEESLSKLIKYWYEVDKSFTEKNILTAIEQSKKELAIV